VLLAVALLCSSMLGIAPQTEPAIDGARRVTLVVAGPEGSRSAVGQTTTELLQRLDLETDVEGIDSLDLEGVVWPATPRAPALARVWIDLSGGSQVAIYIADAAWDRILVRRLAAEVPLDEVAREEIGLIVEAAVEALAEGAEIGIERVDLATELSVAPPPAAPLPVPAASPDPGPREESQAGDGPTPRPTWIGLVAGYRARGWATGLSPLHGPSMSVQLASSGPAGRSRWGLAITAGYTVPVEFDLENLEIRANGGHARLHGVVGVGTRRRVAGRFAAGAGLDMLRFTATSRAGTNAQAAPPQFRLFPAVDVEAGLVFRLGRHRHFVVGVDATIDLNLSGARLVAGDSDAEILPWRVRPGGRLWFGWEGRRPSTRF
jgi:hypothetical protein